MDLSEIHQELERPASNDNAMVLVLLGLDRFEWVLNGDDTPPREVIYQFLGTLRPSERAAAVIRLSYALWLNLQSIHPDPEFPQRMIHATWVRDPAGQVVAWSAFKFIIEPQEDELWHRFFDMIVDDVMNLADGIESVVNFLFAHFGMIVPSAEKIESLRTYVQDSLFRERAGR